MWADFPLALVFLAAVIYLVRFAVDGSSLPLFAVFLAMLPWVKREGLILAAVLATALVWIAFQAGKAGRLPLALLPLVVVSCGWSIFLHSVHASADHDFVPVSFTTAAQNVGRLPFIFSAMGLELLAVVRWTVFWPLAVVAAFHVIWTRSLARWRLLPLIMVALLALYAGIYIFSAWPSLTLHLVTSVPRLLLPVAMPALLLIAVAVPSWRGARMPAQE